MLIDTHVHVWTTDAARYPWQPTLAHVPIPTRAALVEGLLAAMDEAGVDRAVLVQPSTYGWDNRYLSDAIRVAPHRFAGVCLVNPRSSGAADDLRRLCKDSAIRGLRVNVIAESEEPQWLLELHGLWDAVEELRVSVSFQVRPEHVGPIARLAAARPGLTVLVDYIGTEAYHDMRTVDRLKVLLDTANISMKLLAVGQDSREPYPFTDLWPVTEGIVALLSPDRLVFGTDYPIVLAATDYRRASHWREELPFLDAAARERMDANAARIWAFPDEVAAPERG